MASLARHTSDDFVFKTRAEQRVEWLTSLGRPLNKGEVADLQRSLHAIYCRKRKHQAQHEREEASLLSKVEAEALQPDPGRRER